MTQLRAHAETRTSAGEEKVVPADWPQLPLRALSVCYSIHERGRPLVRAAWYVRPDDLRRGQRELREAGFDWTQRGGPSDVGPDDAAHLREEICKDHADERGWEIPDVHRIGENALAN